MVAASSDSYSGAKLTLSSNITISATIEQRSPVSYNSLMLAIYWKLDLGSARISSNWDLFLQNKDHVANLITGVCSIYVIMFEKLRFF